MIRSAKLLLRPVLAILLVFIFISGVGYYHGEFNEEQLKRISSLPNHFKNPFGGPAKPTEKEFNATLLEESTGYIKAILNPADKTFDRLYCPPLNTERYEWIRGINAEPIDNVTLPRYYFALDLYECRHLLPRLLGSIVEVMRFLGPENCVMSVVEGRSKDGTYELLSTLGKTMKKLGVKYHFTVNDINTREGHRIKKLAELRNDALLPLIHRPQDFHPETTVVFSNDISVCSEDILELIHQRHFQKADMTCALDWNYGYGREPAFYDVWISRGMTGDTFFEIVSGTWARYREMFWNDPVAKHRYYTGRPLQVFACWNGIAVVTAKPFMDGTIDFRRNYPNECHQGEPQLFCKDMWYHGYNKIATIPSVNVDYNDESAARVKKDRGYASQWIIEDDQEELIQWVEEPPAEVKCYCCGFDKPKWVPWDEDLPAKEG